MRRGRLVALLLAAAVPAAVASAEDAEQGEPSPSLEYRPPAPVVPQPRQPTPAPPMAIFRESLGGFGIGRGSFDGPVDVAVGRQGEFYVLDAGNSRVQKFDSFGRLQTLWGEFGSRPGEFIQPGAIALDQAGYVYVVDTGNHRVQKFDTEGRFLQSWGSLGSRTGDFKDPRDIVLDTEGHSWVLDAGNERVQRFDPVGRLVTEWGGVFGSRGGEFRGLVSLAWSPDRFGFLYLLDELCGVQKFRPDGYLVESWSAAAPGGGQCVAGRLEYDARAGYLYVLDAGNGLLMRFTPEGRMLAALRGAATPFAKPRGFGMDPVRGDVAVADTENNVVQRFTLR